MSHAGPGRNGGKRRADSVLQSCLLPVNEDCSEGRVKWDPSWAMMQRTRVQVLATSPTLVPLTKLFTQCSTNISHPTPFHLNPPPLFNCSSQPYCHLGIDRYESPRVTTGSSQPFTSPPYLHQVSVRHHSVTHSLSKHAVGLDHSHEWDRCDPASWHLHALVLIWFPLTEVSSPASFSLPSYLFPQLPEESF